MRTREYIVISYEIDYHHWVREYTQRRRHITNPLYKKEEEMIATCIEDNDGESHVLHEVTQTLDGMRYSITLSAEAPDLALKIAREIPLTYWKEEA